MDAHCQCAALSYVVNPCFYVDDQSSCGLMDKAPPSYGGDCGLESRLGYVLTSQLAAIRSGASLLCFSFSFRKVGSCHIASYFSHDLGKTRACNLWLRRPTPYPLGHRAYIHIKKEEFAQICQRIAHRNMIDRSVAKTAAEQRALAPMSDCTTVGRFSLGLRQSEGPLRPCLIVRQ